MLRKNTTWITMIWIAQIFSFQNLVCVKNIVKYLPMWQMKCENFTWNMCTKCENLHLIVSFFYFIPDTQEKQSNDSSTESPKNLEKKQRGAQAVGIISIVILIGVLVALTCWLRTRRRRSSNLVSYTGKEAQHLHDQIWTILSHSDYILLSNKHLAHWIPNISGCCLILPPSH